MTKADVIYRQDAIDMMVEILADATTCMMPKDLWREVVTERISKLPSAQPKTGKWMPERLQCTYGESYKVYRCDQCGVAQLSESNYCPECGAYMRGEPNE